MKSAGERGGGVGGGAGDRRGLRGRRADLCAQGGGGAMRGRAGLPAHHFVKAGDI